MSSYLSDPSSAGGAEEPAVFEQLVERHRERLKRLVQLRMDPRLLARFDASDVVQDALTRACQNEESWRVAADRPWALYAWLREITCNRLVDLHRQHVEAKCRSVSRERRLETPPANDSAQDRWAQVLVDSTSTPSRVLERHELKAMVQEALMALPAEERQILELRHLEQMTPDEIAEMLQIDRGTVSARHLRALTRLQKVLKKRLPGTDV